jgi:hypothetical protein
MKSPNLRAIRREGGRVYVIPIDRIAQRTGPQRRVLERNRAERLACWIEENGIGGYRMSGGCIDFDDPLDAVLFSIAFS